MGTLNLSGALVLEPDTAQGIFPGASIMVALVATNRDYAVSSPAALTNLNSASDYVALPGVGTASPVTKGKFLYVRSEGAMLIRLTTAAASAQVVPLQGLMLVEFQDGDELTVLEAKGVGRVEYLIAGQV